MDWSVVTEETLRAQVPAVVSTIETAARTAAATEHEAGLRAARAGGNLEGRAEARAEGATAERARVLGIQERGRLAPGNEEILRAAIDDGTTTPDQVAARILEAEGQRKKDFLAKRREDLKGDDAPKPAANADPQGGGDAPLDPAELAARAEALVDEAAAKGRTLTIVQAMQRVVPLAQRPAPAPERAT